MLRKLRIIWRIVRRLSGDDAYERYLLRYVEHQQSGCSHTEKPLSKKAFFKKWQDEKWQGIKRCC
jgi:uncharacterized short protein YbdD (DUF466 family)